MTISILAAAKRMCAQSDWSLSNLRLQKLLYIAQMYHLGQEDARLINGHFEAWDYGPVNPGLYHRVKVFGASPVQNIFSDIADLPDCTEAEYLDSVVERFEDSTSGTLVAITHWEQGAWSKHYVPGDRDCVIPDSDIKQEYMDRKRVFEQKTARQN